MRLPAVADHASGRRTCRVSGDTSDTHFILPPDAEPSGRDGRSRSRRCSPAAPLRRDSDGAARAGRYGQRLARRLPVPSPPVSPPVPRRRVLRSRATGPRPSICPRLCGVARLPRSDDGRPGSPRPVRDQPRAFRIKAPDRRPVPCRAQGQGRRLKPTRFCKWAPAVSRNHVLLIVGEVLISK